MEAFDRSAKCLVGFLLAVALAASACGSSGSGDPSEAGTGSTSTGDTSEREASCVPTPVSGPSGSQTVLMPASPVIKRAWRDAQHIYVDLLLPRLPDDCPAVTVLVGASSDADGSNQALAQPGTEGGTRGDGRDQEYRAGALHVELRRPILDLPPYTAYASASGARGERSPIARYRIPEKGDYCLRHRPADRCIREAQVLARRCGRAEVSRARCADWIYGTSKPYPAIPVEGATVAEVRENLRAVLESQTYNNVRLDDLACTPDFVCVATFGRNPDERMRVRYVLSGHEGEAGCWFATTIDVIEPPELAPPSPLQPGVPLNNQAWCLSWRKP